MTAIRLRKATGVAVLMLIAFTYGVTVGRYEFAPFGLLQAAKQVFVPPPPEDELGTRYHRRLTQIGAMPCVSAVILLGDSITSEGEWAELLPDIPVCNRGIGGDSTGSVLARLSHILESPPEIVFVMIGFNDINRGIPVSTAVRNIEALLISIQSSGATPIFQCTLLVGRDRPPSINAQVAILNEAVLRFCKQSGISFLDLNPKLAPNGYLETRYTLDGVHLTGQGYAIWAEEIRQHVERVRGARDATTENPQT